MLNDIINFRLDKNDNEINLPHLLHICLMYIPCWQVIEKREKLDGASEKVQLCISLVDLIH